MHNLFIIRAYYIVLKIACIPLFYTFFIFIQSAIVVCFV